MLHGERRAAGPPLGLGRHQRAHGCRRVQRITDGEFLPATLAKAGDEFVVDWSFHDQA